MFAYLAYLVHFDSCFLSTFLSNLFFWLLFFRCFFLWRLLYRGFLFGCSFFFWSLFFRDFLFWLSFRCRLFSYLSALKRSHDVSLNLSNMLSNLFWSNTLRYVL